VHHSAGTRFIDAVRDEKVWRLTKEGAEKAGGWTLGLLSALGKGFLKKQIERLTDVDIEI